MVMDKIESRTAPPATSYVAGGHTMGEDAAG